DCGTTPWLTVFTPAVIGFCEQPASEKTVNVTVPPASLETFVSAAVSKTDPPTAIGDAERRVVIAGDEIAGVVVMVAVVVVAGGGGGVWVVVVAGGLAGTVEVGVVVVV